MKRLFVAITDSNIHTDFMITESWNCEMQQNPKKKCNSKRMKLKKKVVRKEDILLTFVHTQIQKLFCTSI
jgi:hypothetical protein